MARRQDNNSCGSGGAKLMLAALLVALFSAQSVLTLAAVCGHAASGHNESVASAPVGASCVHARRDEGSSRESKDRARCCLACIARDCDEAAMLPAERVVEAAVKVKGFEIVRRISSGPRPSPSPAGWVSSWSSQGPPLTV